MFLTSYQLLMKTRRNLLSDGVNKLINGNLSGHCGSRQMVRFGVVALVVHNALRNNNLKKLFYHNWIEQWLKDALYSEIIKYYSFCWLFWIPTIHRKFQSTRGAKFALVKVKKKKTVSKRERKLTFMSNIGLKVWGNIIIFTHAMENIPGNKRILLVPSLIS